MIIYQRNRSIRRGICDSLWLINIQYASLYLVCVKLTISDSDQFGTFTVIVINRDASYNMTLFFSGVCWNRWQIQHMPMHSFIHPFKIFLIFCSLIWLADVPCMIFLHVVLSPSPSASLCLPLPPSPSETNPWSIPVYLRRPCTTCSVLMTRRRNIAFWLVFRVLWASLHCNRFSEEY